MRKEKNFSRAKISLPPINLLTIQKKSWQKFWKEDFQGLLTEVSPIRDYTEKKFELSFLDFRLEEPKYKNGIDAKNDNASFEASLKVKVKLVDLKTSKSKEQEVFLANFPLMTNRGTFIIGGIERVTISQLIRSPGVFFTAHGVEKKYFGAKVIPNRGAWLELQTDKKGVIYLKIDRRRKVAATCFLKALGIGDNEGIKDLFKDVDIGEISYIEKTIASDPSKNQEEALFEVYNRLRPGEMSNPEVAKVFIDNLFFNFKRYDLSIVGRWKTWQRLPELQPKSKKNKDYKIKFDDRILKLDDVVAVIREIIRLNNTPGSTPDQIDHLGNRRVRVFTEILLNNLRIGMMRVERIIKDRMASLDVDDLMPSHIINPRPFMAQVQSFFASSQMSQFMDNENPLAELEHKRRLAATGPGGLTRERAGFEARDVQPSHYGRICPIQTPEGQNVGLINYFSIFARVNEYGFIETPYFRVKNGKIIQKPEYFSAYEEEKYTIGSGLILTDISGKILEKEVDARINGEPGIADVKDLDFIDVSSEQCISASTACIPFLQNDDANRALMGSNMQRQSIPLIDPDFPIVGTGMEKRIALDSGQEIIAKESGSVIEVDGSHVKVQTKSSKTKRQVKDYPIGIFVKTNRDTCFHQRPVVRLGQEVKKGDVIAEGGSVSNERLALGKNILVAIMPWHGFNFEDAIVVSERVLERDLLTSIKIKKFICKVRGTKLGPEVITWDIPNIGEDKLSNLDEEGIVRIGAEVDANDILVGKISPRDKETLTPEERLLKAIFGEKAKEVKDTSLKMKYGERGKVMDVKVFSRKRGYRLDPGVIKQIDINVARLRKLSIGDKLANRHGNKGIVAKILPVEDMPFMEDGKPVDIVINPTGIIKRMNLGQILETHLGLVAEKLGYFAISPSFSGATVKDIEEELEKAGISRDGKIVLYDGRTGQAFANRVNVGYMYMMKLDHMSEDKLHMRSIGPYSLITQQPLGGKAQFGGQRFGEMEVWALEGYGAAYTLQEMLTIKSDDVIGRASAYKSILNNNEIKPPDLPASFNLLVNELKSLALNVIINNDESGPETTSKS